METTFLTRREWVTVIILFREQNLTGSTYVHYIKVSVVQRKWDVCGIPEVQTDLRKYNWPHNVYPWKVWISQNTQLSTCPRSGRYLHTSRYVFDAERALT